MDQVKVPAAECANDPNCDGVIKSARRVLELFELFAERREPLSVTDVMQALNYPQSSTSALLKSLTRIGYLDHDRHKRLYAPTLRLALMAGWVQEQPYRQTNLSSLLDDLLRRSGADTLVLGIQNDIYVQYIHVVQTPDTERTWYLKSGSLRPLCRSAAGRVLLSLKSDLEIQQLLRRICAEETDPDKRVDPHEILREVDQIRARGYATTEATIHPTGGVIAVEMPAAKNQPAMALGLGAPISMLRTDRERLLRLMNEAIAPYRPQPTLSARVILRR